LRAVWTEPGPVAEALARFVVCLADSKFFLGRRLAEWSVGAPELESAVACAAVAQEELGHARVLYPLLADLPSPLSLGGLEREHDRAQVFCPAFLTRNWETWPELVVGLAVTDTALTTALESAASSAHGELARRACRIVDEERFHAVFAWGRLRALARGAFRPAAEALLAERVGELLDWLRGATEGLGALKAAAVVDADGGQLRARFLEKVRAHLEAVGLRTPQATGAG